MVETEADIRRSVAKCERKYRGGDLSALSGALWICQVGGIPPPKWIVSAVYGLVDEKENTKRSPGRTGNPKAKLKQAQIHEVRWAAVFHLRKNCPDRAPTWDAAYSEASQALRGSPAQGSAETMMASYKRVQRVHRMRPREIQTAHWLKIYRDHARGIFLGRNLLKSFG